jgi:hypothetical protein
LQLLEDGPKWWKVKSGSGTKTSIGYAAKYYFALKNARDFQKESWFFGEMTRQEAEDLLGDKANPDGSFLIRNNGRGKDVLTLKYFNTRPPEPEEYRYMHYDVKTDEREVWFSSRLKFPSLIELIRYV